MTFHLHLIGSAILYGNLYAKYEQSTGQVWDLLQLLSLQYHVYKVLTPCDPNDLHQNQKEVSP